MGQGGARSAPCTRQVPTAEEYQVGPRVESWRVLLATCGVQHVLRGPQHNS